MDRTIEDVRRIVIDKDNIQILYSAGREDFKRGDWDLYVEDICQVQDERVWVKKPYQRTLFLMESDVDIGCQIVEDRKKIFCGKRPETMGYL
ncbi:hypothetical protein ES703_70816 [subsurface metagenome]